LEILKASGWQTAAISLGCGALLWASHVGLLPPFEPWLVQVTAAAMVICGLLALASFISNAIIQIGEWIASFRERLALRHSIRTLNADETTFLSHKCSGSAFRRPTRPARCKSARSANVHEPW
jgi:hypothetical protein